MDHRHTDRHWQALLATAVALLWFHPLGLPPPAAAMPPGEPSTQAPAQIGAMTEIRALFAEYLKLHATKKMDEWRDKMFLPEALCVRTAADGKVTVYPVADLARTIAKEAKTLKEQRETFEEVRIEVYGHAAHYATTWTLFHNGKVARKGRAFFSLVKKDGAWRIAALVWYRD